MRSIVRSTSYGLALVWLAGCGEQLGAAEAGGRDGHESSRPRASAPELERRPLATIPARAEHAGRATGGQASPDEPEPGVPDGQGAGGAASNGASGSESNGGAGGSEEPREPAWLPPYCAGRPTTQLLIQGNLDATSWSVPQPFDPADPPNTANFSTTATVYTAAGSAATISLYFRRELEGFAYHVLAEGTALQLGSGRLSFDETGALAHHEETQPTRLVGASGFEAPIELLLGEPLDRGGSGLSGLISTPEPFMVARQEPDGARAVLGYACPAGTAPAAPAPSSLPGAVELDMCPASATTQVALRANLAAAAPIIEAPWDVLNPFSTASFATAFWATNDADMVAAFGLYFRKSSANTWEYHVMLESDEPGHELSSGRLTFNESGTLASVLIDQPLHFLEPDGSAGQAIELDFGAPTAEQGSGASGVTSFAMASFMLPSEQNGHGLILGADCSASSPPMSLLWPPSFPSPLPDQTYWGSFSVTPICAGAMSSVVAASLALDSRSPLAEGAWDVHASAGPSDYWSSTIALDAAMREVALQVRFRHVSDAAWEAHVLSEAAGELQELTSVRLSFQDNGLLASVVGERAFSLPLPDGSEGPPLVLVFDGMLAVDFAASGDVWANGTPASDCSAP